MDIPIIAWDCLQVYLLLLLLIAVHEAGHLLAAAALGYRLRGCVVGPVRVDRQSGSLRLSYSRMIYGGQALVFHNPRETRARRAGFILGGPLASLLFGIGFLWDITRLPLQTQDTDWHLGSLLLISAIFFLMSVIPYTYRGGKNDAMLLVDLWRGKARWERYYADRGRYNALYADYEQDTARHTATRTLYAWLRAGRRPRDWDAGTVARATAPGEGSPFEALASHYAFYWAADSGDAEASARHIGRALALLDTLPLSIRAYVLLDGAHHAGVFGADAGTARALLERARACPLPGPEEALMIRAMTLRAEAAVLLAEGRMGEARDRAGEALAALDADKPEMCADRCLVQRLLTLCGETA